MEPTNTAIPWYRSRIIWAQIIATAFAIGAAFQFDIGERIGVSQEEMLTAIMAINGVLTVIFRWGPTPDVVGTPSTAAAQNAEHSAIPPEPPQPFLTKDTIGEVSSEVESPASEDPTTAGSGFSGHALMGEAQKRVRPATEMKPGGGTRRKR